MAKQSLSTYINIKKLHRPVFTTHELASLSGRSLSSTVHTLNVLEREGFIFKIYRGIWAESGNEQSSANAVIPYLFPQASRLCLFCKRTASIRDN